MPDVYVAIGSNVGDRRGHVASAVESLRALSDLGALRLSTIYETAAVTLPIASGHKQASNGDEASQASLPLGDENQDYLNAVAALQTSLSPTDLLSELQRIEQAAGRQRTIYWGPRTLDLDIIFYDQQVIQTEKLTVPHPELPRRWFVLKPMCDLAPSMVHPQLDQTMVEMLEAVEGEGPGAITS